MAKSWHIHLFTLALPYKSLGFPGGSVVKKKKKKKKNPAANAGATGSMQVRTLGWEDSLEKEMAIHSSILAWEVPWTDEPGWLAESPRPWHHKKLNRTECLHVHAHTHTHTHTQA